MLLRVDCGWRLLPLHAQYSDLMLLRVVENVPYFSCQCFARRVLTRTIAVAQSAGLPVLADEAASVLVRVLDENEGDPETAVEGRK